MDEQRKTEMRNHGYDVLEVAGGTDSWIAVFVGGQQVSGKFGTWDEAWADAWNRYNSRVAPSHY